MLTEAREEMVNCEGRADEPMTIEQLRPSFLCSEWPMRGTSQATENHQCHELALKWPQRRMQRARRGCSQGPIRVMPVTGLRCPALFVPGPKRSQWRIWPRMIKHPYSQPPQKWMVGDIIDGPSKRLPHPGMRCSLGSRARMKSEH